MGGVGWDWWVGWVRLYMHDDAGPLTTRNATLLNALMKLKLMILTMMTPASYSITFTAINSKNLAEL